MDSGEASQADVMGQVVTRPWLVLAIAIMCGLKPVAAKAGPVQWLLLATVLLALLQVVIIRS